MKKIFTLVAALLFVGGSAFAQEKWTNIIVNGDMEGAADPLWSSFWCHDWRQEAEFDPESGQQFDEGTATETSKGQFQGFAEIVEDPANPANHCARVIIRSKAEADEAGNPTIDNANNKPDWTEWDSQFFIYATETIAEGKQLRMTLKVKGEKAGSFQTQAHYNPGNYNHYQLFGDINYTTEWTQVEVTATVDANHTQEANGKFFQSVAFNLSTMQDGNVVYFDDVKLEVKDPEEPKELEGWFNFLRKETLSDDQYTFANGTFYNFTGRDGADGVDRQARIVNDPTDGKPALNVTSIGYNDTYEEEVVGDDGEVTVNTYDIYIKENGDTLKTQAGGWGMDSWQTQFFISIPHEFKTGQQYKVSFSARADIPATVETQIHRGPGDYLFYQFLGNLDLTEEWQDFEFEDVIASDANGGSTIAFNLNNLKEANNYYFRVTEFSCNVADVTDKDRTLGSENIVLPVPTAGAEPVAATIDLTNAKEILGVDDVTKFVNDNCLMVKDSKDDEDVLSMEMPAAEILIDDKGYYTEDPNKSIIFTMDDATTKDNILGFTVETFGIDWTAGKSATTKIVFVKDGWYYLYNVSLIDTDAYAGVSNITVDQKAANAIFDLSGRRVAKAAKGLYIVNGKKFIVK